MSLVYNKIEKEQDGKYYMATFWLLLIIFNASVFLMIMFAAAVQECKYLRKRLHHL